jgi:RNA polymerase sigma-70 factor (ECF subfamily)
MFKMFFKNKQNIEKEFKEVYKKYSGMIHTYIACIIPDKASVEDIFQETFIKYYSKYDDNIENIAGYLTTIARNLCMNHKRNTKKTIEFNDNMNDQNITKDYDKKELIELIITSLDLIEEKYREVFIMKEFEGLNYHEIAEHQSINYDNAKRRYLRAKEKLITVLNPYIKELSN